MSWLRTSLLSAVQQAHPLFPHDSKHFVDMPVKTSATAMLQQWRQLEAQQPPASREQLQAFVAEHFAAPGSDMEVVLPEEWDEQGPAYLQGVTPPDVAQLGHKVYNLWRLLHRRVSDDVLAHPERHSLLPLPHPFVVPGDRFREVYYWDSYWILVGLIASGLHRTAVGMLRNMLTLVDTYGFVPNGSRTYYTNRSQPPLLSSMVAVCHAAVTDVEGPEAARQLLKEALPRLVKTWEYWTTGDKALSVCSAGVTAAAGRPEAAGTRAAGGAAESAQAAGAAGAAGAGKADGSGDERQSGGYHQLSRYSAQWDEPRPESYREDVALASGLPEQDAKRLYREIASAAESGWDFSSRWFADGQSLATIRTTQVVPVDLNALLFQTASHIAAFADELGDAATAATFSAKAAALKAAIHDLMWSEQAGCWQDLLLVQRGGTGTGGGSGCGTGTTATSGAAAAAGAAEEAAADTAGAAIGALSAGVPGRAGWVTERLPGCYASNWVPLWCGCCEPGSDVAHAAVAGLQASGLIAEGGVLTSFYETGQQWDAPNAWAPLQHVLIQGLRDSGVPQGEELAEKLARAWVRNNRLAFERTGHMHEKYNAREPGAVGGGGEYQPQVGFGWTNGLLLELLRLYPNQGS